MGRGGSPSLPGDSERGRASALGGGRAMSAANPGLAAPSPLPGPGRAARFPAARRWRRCVRGEARGEARRTAGGPMASMACEVMPLQRYVSARGSPRPKRGRAAFAGLPDAGGAWTPAIPGGAAPLGPAAWCRCTVTSQCINGVPGMGEISGFLLRSG